MSLVLNINTIDYTITLMLSKITTKLAAVLLMITVAHASNPVFDRGTGTSLTELEETCRCAILDQLFERYPLTLSTDPQKFHPWMHTNVLNGHNIEIKDTNTAFAILKYLYEHLEYAVKNAIFGENAPRSYFAFVQNRIRELNQLLNLEPTEEENYLLSHGLSQTYIRYARLKGSNQYSQPIELLHQVRVVTGKYMDEELQKMPTLPMNPNEIVPDTGLFSRLAE